MRVWLEKEGAEVPLDGEPIARGGEAAIWAASALSGMLAKVYFEPKPERGDKLTAMLANPPDDPTAAQGHTSIAWPTQRLLDEDRRCVGFLMPRIEKAVSLFDVYNPKSRLQTWPLFHYGYLLRTACNLAVAVRALHARGYVLGDLNESNVLVNVQTLVAVVDTDSFQVRAGERVFRCLVGKPEYIAPEIQGADFQHIDRTPEQDNFALAVLIFQLLMQGTHPFAGRYTGQGEPAPPARRIAAGQWPFARPSRGPYEPIPTAPPLSVLPFPVRELMRQCFEDGHARPTARPAASDWQKALIEADAELTDCVVNPQHFFHKSLDACPWCELREQQGRDPFPSREQVKSRTELAVGRTATVVVPAIATAASPAGKAKPAIAARSNPALRKAPRSPAPVWLRLVLTPWPWLICLGAAGLGVLIWLIAVNPHHAAATSSASAVQNAGPSPTQPIKPRPADAKPAPIVNLAGSEWHGDDGPTTMDLIVQFEEGGVLAYSHDGAMFRDGTWKQTGESLYFEMNDKYRECQATIHGDQIDGDSWNMAGDKWRTTLHRTR
ncbi:MAG TPA: hypothetical protein VMS17_24300 [Gemmataceae bacterium]|nr:hypothetical protein [Gemmataceae bacterium]